MLLSRCWGFPQPPSPGTQHWLQALHQERAQDEGWQAASTGGQLDAGIEGNGTGWCCSGARRPLFPTGYILHLGLAPTQPIPSKEQAWTAQEQISPLGSLDGHSTGSVARAGHVLLAHFAPGQCLGTLAWHPGDKARPSLSCRQDTAEGSRGTER